MGNKLRKLKLGGESKNTQDAMGEDGKYKGTADEVVPNNKDAAAGKQDINKGDKQGLDNEGLAEGLADDEGPIPPVTVNVEEVGAVEQGPEEGDQGEATENAGEVMLESGTQFS